MTFETASRDGALHVLISGSDNPDAAVAEARSAADLLGRTLGNRIDIGVGTVRDAEPRPR